MGEDTLLLAGLILHRDRNKRGIHDISSAWLILLIGSVDPENMKGLVRGLAYMRTPVKKFKFF